MDPLIVLLPLPSSDSVPLLLLRGLCTGFVGALNRYYAFGSVFVDDERG